MRTMNLGLLVCLIIAKSTLSPVKALCRAKDALRELV